MALFVQKSLTPPLKSGDSIEKKLNKINILPAGADNSSKLYFSFFFSISVKLFSFSLKEKGVGLSADWEKCCLINNKKPGQSILHLILATILQCAKIISTILDKW